MRAIAEVGEQLPGQAALAAQRRAIVQQSTELRERAGTKFAEATDALAEALRQRGTPAATAALLAEVGTALFRSAFERWTDEPGRASDPQRPHLPLTGLGLGPVRRRYHQRPGSTARWAPVRQAIRNGRWAVCRCGGRAAGSGPVGRARAGEAGGELAS